MTASKGIWKRYVVESIDTLPRTVPQWAKLLGLSKHIINDRAKRLGGVPQAVKALKEGTAPAVFCCKTTKGVCKRGHKIEGENGVMIAGILRCKKCYRKGPAKKLMPNPTGNPRPRDMCNLGLHLMTPENVIVTVLKDGRKKRRCKACKSQYTRRRGANLKMGIVPLVRPGQTIEERIAIFSDPQPNGCVFWTGRTGNAGVPMVNHKIFLPTSGRPVGMYLWEKRTGQPVPHHHMVRASCGDIRCIAEDQLVCILITSAMTPESIAKRWKTRRRNYVWGSYHRELDNKSSGTREQITAAQQYKATVLGTLRGKFGRRLSPQDQEDIWQGALMRVFVTMREGKEIFDLKSNVRAVAVNLAFDQMRSRWHRSTVLVDTFEEDAESADNGRIRWSMLDEEHGDPSLLLERWEEEERDRMALKNRFNALTDAPRRCYLLRCEGMNNIAIAKRLGITVRTVEQNLQKLFDALRETPKGRERRPLLIPMDITRHHYGIAVRRNEPKIQALLTGT